MAATCFGPPPLPPNKKSSLVSGRFRKPDQSFLSSTYRSFRDPAEENEIVVMTVKEPDLIDLKCKPIALNNSCRRVSHTNSLRRTNAKLTLMRSHSDGNLSKKDTTGSAPMTINKYFKVLSGSWRNLLNCK